MTKRMSTSNETAEDGTVTAVRDSNSTESLVRPRKRQKRDIVFQTNALAHGDFAIAYLAPDLLHYPSVAPPSFSSGGEHQGVKLQLSFANDLQDPSIRACFDLIESTSRVDYEASTNGWRPKQKLKEMKQPEMCYLLARQYQDATNANVDDEVPASADLKGFLSFMVTHEDGVPVLYVYEIHLAQNARGIGLGKHLMRVAYNIAQRIGRLKKIMLTCFISNTSALNFYRKLGYEIDESSPADRRTRGKLVKADYVIMSRHVDSLDGEALA